MSVDRQHNSMDMQRQAINHLRHQHVKIKKMSDAPCASCVVSVLLCNHGHWIHILQSKQRKYRPLNDCKARVADGTYFTHEAIKDMLNQWPARRKRLCCCVISDIPEPARSLLIVRKLLGGVAICCSDCLSHKEARRVALLGKTCHGGVDCLVDSSDIDLAW